MPVTPLENANGTLVHYGDHVRIERHFKQEADGSIKWAVYQNQAVKRGRHPVHQTETNEGDVWIRVGDGTRDNAHALAMKLAGK